MHTHTIKGFKAVQSNILKYQSHLASCGITCEDKSENRGSSPKL